MATITTRTSCFVGNYKYLHSNRACYHYFNGSARGILDSRIVIADTSNPNHRNIITTIQSHPLSSTPQQHFHQPQPHHLPKPFIIYQNNHLLVLYKPPGWHSIPNQTKFTPSETTSTSTINSTTNTGTASKCLLTYCQSQKYGGGSQYQYIKPIHRIDQPCSGILIYGKTTKVASRIQTAFMNTSRASPISHHHHPDDTLDHPDESNPPQPARPSNTKQDNEKATNMIQKIYYVMVRIQHHHHHRHKIESTISGTWNTLQGIMLSKSNHIAPHPQQPQTHNNNNKNNKGWSVQMIPATTPPHEISSNQKLCTLQYRIVQTYPIQKNNANIRLLQVRTQQGSRHLIRAMLACHQMTVVGDVRYGDNDMALPDQSVALHAYSIRLNRTIVDKTKKKRRNGVETAETTNNHQNDHREEDGHFYYWKAAIPNTWDEYFDCTQAMIDQWEEQYPTKM